MASYEITVTHLSGSRRSAVETYTRLPLRIGRGDDCQLRFDPEQDRQVSALHAEIGEGGGGLVVKDLGSKNGLLLNGAPVEGEAPLPNRGVLEVGAGGPRVQVAYEVGGGGIDFNRIRRDQTAKGQFRPLATTDDSFPASRFAEELEGPAPGRRKLIVGALVGLLLVGGGVAAWVATH